MVRSWVEERGVVARRWRLEGGRGGLRRSLVLRKSREDVPHKALECGNAVSQFVVD